MGRDVVETLNEKYKYEYVPEIDDQAFLDWLESSGFTIRELAMIQPAYGPKVVEEVERTENSVDLSYGIGSSVLTSANILYHTNNPRDPWLFNEASSNHWFGLVAGSGSILIGALNLESNRSYKEAIGMDFWDPCYGMYCPPLREVHVTNYTRTAVSIANMGIGLFTALRAGYHLVKGTNRRKQSTSLGVTQLEPNPIETGVPVPAVQIRFRF
ncbi:MAG: hypothetical protein R3220_11655 [Balneolaceae bacterium]|nr:hypothetical protein [Balneolaceae bacterium]